MLPSKSVNNNDDMRLLKPNGGGGTSSIGGGGGRPNNNNNNNNSNGNNVNPISTTDTKGDDTVWLLDGSPANTGGQQVKEVVTDHLDTAISLEQLLVKPNIAPNSTRDVAEELARMVNKHDLAGRSGLGTNVVDPGKIGLISYNGQVELVPPGRWVVPNVRAEWVRTVSLTDNPIIFESLTILRVQKGHYSLAEDNGSFLVLSEGIHVRNSRLFRHRQFVDVNQKYINHGTVHLLRVPVGEYALVYENNKPKILSTGEYVSDSNYFALSAFVDVNQAHIQHGTIHIIRVLKGQIALINDNVKPVLLHEGTHTFNSQVLVYHGVRDVNDPHVTHGTITRFRVRNGDIGLAWEDNKPVFIEAPGVYEVDSPTFSFVKCVPASDKHIELGSRKRIVVYDGEVGISYINGKLDILQPKAHVFDAVDRVFVNFLSTKQQLTPLSDGGNTGYLRCDTKDFVEIGIKAAVFYRISDPEKALLTVGDASDIEKLVKETSIATLQLIVRSTALSQVAQSKNIAAISEDDMRQHGHAPSAPLFFDMVHDEFISRLHDNFKKTYGIEIANIRVESFKIMNSELADNISKQAIITAQTENKLANLEGQRQIATAEMERDSAVTMIKAQAAASQLAMEVQARTNAAVADAQSKAQAAKIMASGEAEALLIKAEAEAKALQLKAEAEARSIEVRASAEKKRAQDLGSTPLGAQIALLSLQSEMVTKSMQGVSKIIYLPSNANLTQYPQQLFGIPQMGFPSMFPTGDENSVGVDSVDKKK